MSDNGFKFGQAASDYVDPGNVQFIWTFKDPSTQIRICPASGVSESDEPVFGSDSWPTEREHYEGEIKAFPCVERFGAPCVGCNHPDPKVQDRSRKYYVNALDDKGKLHPYKFGANLYKIFKGREQRFRANDPSNIQPLSDRDYIIIRSGSGMDTTYDPETGDRYEADFTGLEMFDISAILAAQYDLALEAFTGKSGKAAENRTRAMTPEAHTAAVEASSKPVMVADTNVPWQTWGNTPTEEQIDDASTPDIKAWLDLKEVEYPSRAPRARLVEMAKKAIEPPF